MVSPAPIPILGVSKSILPGGKQIRKKQIVWWSYMIFMKNKPKKYPARGGLKRGPRKKNSRFPEGFQKEQIQQWRKGRSRPREKETLNIMLR